MLAITDGWETIYLIKIFKKLLKMYLKKTS